MSYYGDSNKEWLRDEINDFLSKGYDLAILMDVVADCIRDYEVENKVKRGKWMAQDPCRGYEVAAMNTARNVGLRWT